MLGLIVALLLVALSLGYGYTRWKHSHWASKGIHGPKPTPFMGHLKQMFVGERWTFIKECYFKYKDDKYFGLYERHSPSLFVCEPEVIKKVLIKDFSSFADRRHIDLPPSMEWMGEMLSMMNGEKWKKLRSTMSPTFSSGKIKNMYDIVTDQAKAFVKHCEVNSKSGEEFELKNAFSRYTMDVIAESSFGIKCDSLLKDDAVFAKNAELVFTPSKRAIFITLIFMISPKLAVLILKVIRSKDPWKFFLEVSTQTMEERRNATKRGDFLDLMLDEQEKQANNFNNENDYKITELTVKAQCTLFLVAGYDTTASALGVTAYHLGANQDVQDNLRQELKEIIEKHGQFEYHTIMEAKYLDACISEALRINPTIPWLERVCTKDYTIEGTEIHIPKGMLVGIPVWGLHRDPEFWENPEVYEPDRFLPENKDKIVPFTYMPFGLGPRNCIAMRFALMEAKLCLAHLVLNYKFTLPPGKEELKLVNGGGLIKPEIVPLVLTPIPNND